MERLRREAASLEDRAEQLRGTLEATRSEAAGAAAERERLQLQRASLLAEHEAMRTQVPAHAYGRPGAFDVCRGNHHCLSRWDSVQQQHGS